MRAPHHRRGPVLLVTLATASALLGAPAAADDAGGDHGHAGHHDHHGHVIAASHHEHASDTLLVTVRHRGEVPAVVAALDGVADVAAASRRVLTVDGDHGEIVAALEDHPVTIEHDVVLRGADIPNDPLFDTQWGMHNTGQTHNGSVGQEGLDVGALRAWAHTRGNRDQTIAVVDTRIYPHPDLDANLGQGSGDRFVGQHPTRECHLEFAAHASEVAGVAAAVANNGEGVAGLAPRARIMPVAFLDNCGFGSLSGASNAIGWAAANGADVIIASFASERGVDGRALRTAIEDAGVPVIAAAGNAEPGSNGDGTDLSGYGASPVFPASFSLRNLVSVASIDREGELSRFSNYGHRDVELGAPGRDIRTTSVNYTGIPGYRYQSGTSFAAPFVAASFVLGQSLHPVLSSEAILDLILDTTRPLDSLATTTITGATLDTGELVVQLARGGSCPTELVPRAGFGDVPTASPHRLAIDCIGWWDISQGRVDGTYAPGEPVTRAQMATFLAAIVDEVEGLPDSPPRAFDDVPSGVHRPAIDALAALDIIGGYPDGTYRPGSRVTRAQMATFLINTYEHLLGPAPWPAERWFEDTGTTVHAENADRLWELGITAGIDTRIYAPAQAVSRDQMASFLARLLDHLVRDGVVEGLGDADEYPRPVYGDDPADEPDDTEGGADDPDADPDASPDEDDPDAAPDDGTDETTA